MKSTYHAQSVLRWSTAVAGLLERLAGRMAARLRNRPVRFRLRHS